MSGLILRPQQALGRLVAGSCRRLFLITVALPALLAGAGLVTPELFTPARAGDWDMAPYRTNACFPPKIGKALGLHVPKIALDDTGGPYNLEHAKIELYDRVTTDERNFEENLKWAQDHPDLSPSDRNKLVSCVKPVIAGGYVNSVAFADDMQESWKDLSAAADVIFLTNALHFRVLRIEPELLLRRMYKRKFWDRLLRYMDDNHDKAEMPPPIVMREMHGKTREELLLDAYIEMIGSDENYATSLRRYGLLRAPLPPYKMVFPQEPPDDAVFGDMITLSNPGLVRKIDRIIRAGSVNTDALGHYQNIVDMLLERVPDNYETFSILQGMVEWAKGKPEFARLLEDVQSILQAHDPGG